MAIIALLLAILLPSLSTARERARRAVCLSHLNQIGKARALYGTEYDDWLAGPATSGYGKTHGNPWSEIQAEDVSSSTTPLQNVDWVSPTLGKLMKFPARDIKRLVEALNSKLCCPSNHEHYDADADGESVVAGVPVDQIRYASYVAAEAFHLLGKDKAVNARSVTARKADVEMPDVSTGLVDFPDAYVPRENEIGCPAEKVYVLEGSRSVLNGLVTFNDWHYQDEGGNFMALGPAVGRRRDPTVLTNGRLNEMNRRYAWRHDEGMNLVYFDGHAAYMKWDESLCISLYFPTGTIVMCPSKGQDPDAYEGMVIP